MPLARQQPAKRSIDEITAKKELSLFLPVKNTTLLLKQWERLLVVSFFVSDESGAGPFFGLKSASLFVFFW
jgi:hypothetical protein